MSLQSELAFAQQDRRIALGHDLARRLIRLWRTVPLKNLDAGWQFVAPKMQALVASAQLTAADQAAPYLAVLDRSYGLEPKPAAIVPEAFANVMGDGREVAPALFGAVTNTKKLIGAGLAPTTAFESGAAFLSMVAQAALHDMARNADLVLGAGRGYTRYVRVVNGAACSRCAILAGIYSGPDAFKRHTGCQCGAVALPEDRKAPKGLHDSPQSFFDSLSRSEQDRRFTKSGAEAIRQGASVSKVVNARRGARGLGYSSRITIPGSTRSHLKPLTIGIRADGTPLQVFATTEGTTARGQFFKSERDRVAGVTREGRYTRSSTIRLMPEQISIMAGNDPERWVELLYKYGYLDPSSGPARRFR